MNKVDERDIMFSRMNLNKDWPEYKDYYSRNPDKLEIDEELRNLPLLGEEGSVTYNSINSPIVDATFQYLADIKKYAEGDVYPVQVELSPKDMTLKLKELSKFFGAKLVGITEMKDYHYYSHRGREKASYGDEINFPHKYGIVFAVEMDKDFINAAPNLPEAVAVVKGYLDTANIGMVLSYYIRSLGYDARNHMDGNYLVIAPLVAKDAGLGELGRHGLLITKEYGPRIRLGVVTTDLNLIADSEIDFGIQEFCNECGRCAKTCPGKCIPKEEKHIINDELRWQINPEQCYKRWRSLGTDCGICLSNCPFSQDISLDLINEMKNFKEIREKILIDFQEKYGVRPFNRELPEWIKK